jgi:hypothetical protein
VPATCVRIRSSRAPQDPNLFPERTLATAAELTTIVATLDERVKNHIRFFWTAVAFGFLWLAAITGLVIRTNGSVDRVERAQADAPAQIAARLLDKPVGSRDDEASRLSAVAAILRSAPVGRIKPETPVLDEVSLKLSASQGQYPDLPQVWQATAALITYKSGSSATSRPLGIARGSACTMKFGGQGFVLTNCDVALEDLAQRFANDTFNGVPAAFTFIDCDVRYRGGAIPAKQMAFFNSKLSFFVPGVPERSGMRAMEQLTTADLHKPVTISLS